VKPEDRKRIAGIRPDSIASEAGLEHGDILLAINGQEVPDILAYIRQTEEEEVMLDIRKMNGDILRLEIEKDADEDIGLIFENPLLDQPIQCCNRCTFCFIDQLPHGLRSGLYVKDDDWRLSFLMGNYITLTNLADDDMQRIIAERISPLYISVHATGPAIRRRMMGHVRAGDILWQMRRLARAGIQMRCQIVLCPGYNDKDALDNTLSDLFSLDTAVQSVAVVPVGLTRCREGLTPLEPVGRETAIDTIGRIEAWQTRALKKTGRRFVFAADELYILAGMPYPPYEEYEEFTQLDNGVGLAAKLLHEVQEALNALRPLGGAQDKVISAVTGVAAAPLMEDIGRRIKEKTGITLQVFALENGFFGPEVTVAGLLTGNDIVSGLSGKNLGKALLIPDCMLKDRGYVFLDGMDLGALSRALEIKVYPVVADSGGALVRACLEA
jgi:putative radical SAM enzyme (TIGR03279 family)